VTMELLALRQSGSHNRAPALITTRTLSAFTAHHLVMSCPLIADPRVEAASHRPHVSDGSWKHVLRVLGTTQIEIARRRAAEL